MMPLSAALLLPLALHASLLHASVFADDGLPRRRRRGVGHHLADRADLLARHFFYRLEGL